MFSIKSQGYMGHRSKSIRITEFIDISTFQYFPILSLYRYSFEQLEVNHKTFKLMYYMSRKTFK